MIETPEPVPSLLGKLERVPVDDILTSTLRSATVVLREVVENTSVSLGLRARAEAVIEILEAIAHDSLGDLRRAMVDELSRSSGSAAAELPDWDGASKDRPAGLDGLLHLALPSGGSACELPASAIEVLRSRFVAHRINSCAVCSSKM